MTILSAVSAHDAPPASAADLADLLEQLVAEWHAVEPTHGHDGLAGRVCDNHRFNFLLWHEEDIARSPDVSDTRIAEVKRAIDGYNQARNDAIEKTDDWLVGELNRRGVEAPADAPASTETPGAALDRLSILELRRYHMQEQLERTDASQDHLEKVAHKMAVLDLQRQHLTEAIDRLLAEIFAGSRPLRVYRQMKMYNDPTMNPYLYKARRAAA